MDYTVPHKPSKIRISQRHEKAPMDSFGRFIISVITIFLLLWVIIIILIGLIVSQGPLL